jgi:hypothetical protein
MSDFDDGMSCVHGVASCDSCLDHHSAQVRDLERQLAEAQAQAGAMREALLADEPTEYQALKAWHAKREAALAPEAGKELLTRLEKAEQERDRWRATSYSLHPFNVRAAALEEAAKVAEKTDAILQLPTGSEWVGKALAAAIRTLATAPKGET